MSKVRLALAGATITLLLLVILWMGGVFTAKMDPTLNEPVNNVSGDVLVIELERITQSESVPGSIVARNETIVSSRLLSTVKTLSVRSGATVTAEEVIATLDEADLSSRVDQAEQRVNAITARVADARLRLDRTRELIDRQLAAQADLDSAQADYDSLAAELETARQALKETRVVLGYTTIRAPIGGRVVERFADPGDTVSPGSRIVSIYDPTAIRVEASIRESLAVGIALGQPIQIIIPSVGKTVEGIVEEIVPAADTASRSFVVRVRMPYQAEFLPGMFASISVPAAPVDVILVPENCVRSVGELDYVTIASGNRLARRFIRIGPVYRNGYKTVVAGLQEGDRLPNSACTPK